MKRVFFFTTFLFFSLFAATAQCFQLCEMKDEPYLRFNFSNTLKFYNVDHDEHPLSMASDVIFVSDIGMAQAGFSFKDEEARFGTNAMGFYNFDFGLTLGLIWISNLNFYYDLAKEVDYMLASYISYKTHQKDYWKFCWELGYGGMATWIQYKINGRKKWTRAELCQIAVANVTVIKHFLEKHTVWGDIHTIDQFDFIQYGLSPSFTFGYAYDFNETWRVYGELKLDYLSLCTSFGETKDLGIKLGACYNFPLGGKK